MTGPQRYRLIETEAANDRLRAELAQVIDDRNEIRIKWHVALDEVRDLKRRLGIV